MPSSDYYEVVQLRTNRPAVLPCQVTSPQAKVSLHREFPPMEVKVDGAEISFEVTRGFTIHRPKQHHAGYLYCVASLGNLRQSSTKYMLIYVNCEFTPRNTPAQGRRLDLDTDGNSKLVIIDIFHTLTLKYMYIPQMGGTYRPVLSSSNNSTIITEHKTFFI